MIMQHAAPGDLVPAPERRITLACAVLASSLGFIDGSVVSVAVPAMRSDIGASFSELQWITNAYMLFLSALILVGGAAGDRFGQREAFAAGILVFSLASIACALAPSPAALILARAAQGAGAALMVPGSLALIARAYPPNERGGAIGLWSMASGIAAALGPLFGGMVLDLGGSSAWRWIFWINPPVGALALFLLYRYTRRYRPSRARRIDVAGALLATLALAGVSLALTHLSEPQRSDALVGISAVGGILAMAGFVWWEARAREPMLPLHLFRSRTFTGANILTFFLYFALAGSLFFLPMTLIEAMGVSETEAGSVYLPFTVAMSLVAQFSGRYADRRGPRLPITAGSLVVAASFLLVDLAVHHSAFAWGVLPAMAVLGLGMGLVVAPLSTAVMTSTDDTMSGIASAVNNGVARIAGLFAVAALGLVATLVYSAMVDQALAPGGYGEPAVGMAEGAGASRAEAMTAAFTAVCIVTAVLSVLSALTAWITLARRPAGEVQPA
jgi:EmrB/QacA subfamily drug resistance transporter